MITPALQGCWEEELRQCTERIAHTPSTGEKGDPHQCRTQDMSAAMGIFARSLLEELRKQFSLFLSSPYQGHSPLSLLGVRL